MQTIKFTSHRSRGRAFYILPDEEIARVSGKSIYGTIKVQDHFWEQLKGIPGVVRIAKESDPLPSPDATIKCVLI